MFTFPEIHRVHVKVLNEVVSPYDRKGGKRIIYGLQFCRFYQEKGAAFNAYRFVLFNEVGRVRPLRCQTPMPLDIVKALISDMETKERMDKTNGVGPRVSKLDNTEGLTTFLGGAIKDGESNTDLEDWEK